MIQTLANVSANLTVVPLLSSLTTRHVNVSAETRGNAEMDNFMTTTLVSASV